MSTIEETSATKTTSTITIDDTQYLNILPFISKELDKDEYLLQPVKNRHVLFPITHNDVFELYKKAVSTFWTVEEVDLTKDIVDWENKLNDNERHFIKNVIGFFASSDGIVMENLAVRFLKEIELPEARSFYSYQIFDESVHAETYSLLIDTYIKDNDEKKMIFNSVENIPCIAQKANWALKWINNSEINFATRLLAFAVVEGIFFSGSFCAIYWLKKRGLMPGLAFSNELISRDEGMHCEFACLLYSMIKNKVPANIVHSIFREAVDIEKEFITDSIPCALIGMNANLMKQYIEFVADRLLAQLGYQKLFNVDNCFDFMELLSLRPKANFFELKVSEYSKNTNNVSNITMTDDF